MSIYLLAIGIGVVLRIVEPTKDDVYYQTFKGMIPFVFAIPEVITPYALRFRTIVLLSYF
jgi:hypothetical protein